MHIVKYTESEKGFGGEIWFRGFQTKPEAENEVQDVMKDYNRNGPVPEYYIIAEYVGEQDKVPDGIRF